MSITEIESAKREQVVRIHASRVLSFAKNEVMRFSLRTESMSLAKSDAEPLWPILTRSFSDRLVRGCMLLSRPFTLLLGLLPLSAGCRSGSERSGHKMLRDGTAKIGAFAADDFAWSNSLFELNPGFVGVAMPVEPSSQLICSAGGDGSGRSLSDRPEGIAEESATVHPMASSKTKSSCSGTCHAFNLNLYMMASLSSALVVPGMYHATLIACPSKETVIERRSCSDDEFDPVHAVDTASVMSTR